MTMTTMKIGVMTMSSSFNAFPQRRAKTHNADWTKNVLADKARRNPSAKLLAANRAKIARLEELVRRGQVKPVVISERMAPPWLGPFACKS